MRVARLTGSDLAIVTKKGKKRRQSVAPGQRDAEALTASRPPALVNEPPQQSRCAQSEQD